MTDTLYDDKPGTPSARGLTIDRVFTTEGVHPYDEVTWEKRSHFTNCEPVCFAFFNS